MTYKEKLVWLNRYRAAEKDARHLSDQIAAAQTAAARTTQALSPLPGGGGDGQNLARAIERKTELEQKADALRPLRKQYYKEIFDALSRSGLSYTDYQILHKRYLECKGEGGRRDQLRPALGLHPPPQGGGTAGSVKQITIQITVSGVK